MNPLDAALREMIVAIVREELAKARLVAAQPDEYYSTATAAERADVSQRTIRRWIREDKLRASSAAGKLRVRRRDLETLLRGDKPGKRGELTPEQVADRLFPTKKSA